MATQVIKVALGTTTAPFAVTPQTSVCVGPQVLGGSVLLEFAKNPTTGPWIPWMPGTITQGASFRSDSNGWVRATATTSAATLALCDIGVLANPTVDQIVNITQPLTTASATAEQVLASFRTASLLMPLAFRMRLDINVSLTNNANVKTLFVRANGLGGTALYTSPSLASQLNHNATAQICGRADGQTLIGFGPGASGGVGNSTTAYPTLARDYINQETEWVVSASKATAGDSVVLESLLVTLF